jgi:hypothetical protein
VLCRKPGSFCGLQLLSGEQIERSVDSITRLLATGLVTDAPLQDELGWMNNFTDKVCGSLLEVAPLPNISGPQMWGFA